MLIVSRSVRVRPFRLADCFNTRSRYNHLQSLISPAAKYRNISYPAQRSPGHIKASLVGSTLTTRSIVSNMAQPSNGTRNMSHKAVIALGSNMGDRVGHIESALHEITKKGLRVIKTSHLYETKPMYYEDQDLFLNGVCQVETDLDPLPLLDALQDIEHILARKRIIANGPRTIDLDILLYDQEHITHERLEVPHKLMLEREFVLRPLADILPDDTLPPTFDPSSSNQTIQQYLEKLPNKDKSMSPVIALTPNMKVIRTNDPTRPTHVMAILNMTPDSFSDGGIHSTQDLDSTLSTIKSFIADGATIIDVGGQSTRPNATLLTPAQELERILPVIELIRNLPSASHIAISIDTFYSSVAEACIHAGADIINDVSGGTLDSEMLPVVASLGKTIVLMHMRGTPHTMTNLTSYPAGLLPTLTSELSSRVTAAHSAGIPRWRMLVDPGIGFAKNQSQNLLILSQLATLRSAPEFAGLAWLVGTSRKTFVGRVTGVEEPSQRTWGTAATVTACVAAGVDVVRVHDVREMSQVAKMADAIYRTPA